MIHALSQLPQQCTPFSDSKIRPTISLKNGDPQTAPQLVFEVYALLLRAEQPGHSAKSQYALSHCRLPGSEMAGTAAKFVHTNVIIIRISLGLYGVKRVAPTLRKHIAATLWKHPHNSNLSCVGSSQISHPDAQ